MYIYIQEYVYKYICKTTFWAINGPYTGAIWLIYGPVHARDMAHMWPLQWPIHRPICGPHVAHTWTYTWAHRLLG